MDSTHIEYVANCFYRYFKYNEEMSTLTFWNKLLIRINHIEMEYLFMPMLDLLKDMNLEKMAILMRASVTQYEAVYHRPFQEGGKVNFLRALFAYYEFMQVLKEVYGVDYSETRIEYLIKFRPTGEIAHRPKGTIDLKTLLHLNFNKVLERTSHIYVWRAS